MTGLLLALAGGLGALARFGADSAIARLHSLRMPLGTLAVNVLGSGLLGVLTGAMLFHGAPPEWSIAGVGFLGGFTTFSSACVEGVRLLRAGRPEAAALHAAGGLLASVAAAALGLWVAGL